MEQRRGNVDVNLASDAPHVQVGTIPEPSGQLVRRVTDAEVLGVRGAIAHLADKGGPGILDKKTSSLVAGEALDARRRPGVGPR